MSYGILMKVSFILPTRKFLITHLIFTVMRTYNIILQIAANYTLYNKIIIIIISQYNVIINILSCDLAFYFYIIWCTIPIIIL